MCYEWVTYEWVTNSHIWMRQELILVTCCSMMLHICIYIRMSQATHTNESHEWEVRDSWYIWVLWLLCMFEFVTHSYVWVRAAFICMSSWLIHMYESMTPSYAWVHWFFTRMGSWRIRITREYMETKSITPEEVITYQFVTYIYVWVRDAFMPHVTTWKPDKVHRKKSSHISVCDSNIRASSWHIHTTGEYMETKSVTSEKVIRAFAPAVRARKIVSSWQMYIWFVEFVICLWVTWVVRVFASAVRAQKTVSSWQIYMWPVWFLICLWVP